MERINTEPNLIHLKPLHHRRSASRASENDDRSPIAGRAAGALGNWWGGSSAVSHVSSGMSMRVSDPRRSSTKHTLTHRLVCSRKGLTSRCNIRKQNSCVRMCVLVRAIAVADSQG